MERKYVKFFCIQGNYLVEDVFQYSIEFPSNQEIAFTSDVSNLNYICKLLSLLWKGHNDKMNALLKVESLSGY